MGAWHVLVQQLHNVQMPAVRGNIAWPSVHVVGDVTIGSVIEECLDGLQAPFACSQKQGSLFMHVLSITVGSVSQEDPH